MNRLSQRKRRTLFAFTFASVAALMIVLGAKRLAQAQDTGTRNLVYVESNINTTGGNTVLGFSNDGRGNLTALPGSPYPTFGTGVVAGSGNLQIDADQQVIANPEGTLLYAVDGHSNDVAGFTINTDGSLTAIGGSPFPSGGQDPASIGYKDNAFGGGASLMVVVNKNSDPNQTGGTPNYTTFDVSSAGVMTMNPGSTFNLAAGSSPAQALVIPGQNKFFGIEFQSQRIVTYLINKNGSLSDLSSTTPPGSSAVVLGAAIDPKFKKTLYVGMPGQNQVDAFTYDAVGHVTFVNSASNPGVAVCWLVFNSAATRLYTSDSGSGTVTVYNVSSPGLPVETQHFTLSKVNGAMAEPINLSFDTTGHFIYVLDGPNQAIHILQVAANGTVTEPNPPFALTGLPAGTVPFGMAVVK
ncbi:MAG TPA: beta-propeller fold lactonase family protein [Terriglobia bacterium]|nr:beta-propeller fold lactonase family protein [Terriglobia bacterium]